METFKKEIVQLTRSSPRKVPYVRSDDKIIRFFCESKNLSARTKFESQKILLFRNLTPYIDKSFQWIASTLLRLQDTQIIKFLHHRVKVFPNDDMDHKNPFYWKYLVYEVLYLWNALGNVNYDQLDQIIDGEWLAMMCLFHRFQRLSMNRSISDCTASNEIAEEPMIGIKKLILGSALTSQRRFQSAVVACKWVIRLLRSSTSEFNVCIFQGLHQGTPKERRLRTHHRVRSLWIGHAVGAMQ